ncbi:FtsK/SpoIIIE domain-containing protein [Streptomyces sp. NPDC005245]|uniref:FtsK/SpoIIIE domain-containing protein n=1 Tax=Streptomyces sp. NPDC005245 TaxID=3157029 RepID=UPI0033AF2C4B
MNELNEAFGWLRGAVWLGLGLIALWAVVWVVRYLMASPMERISIRQAVRIRWGWKRLAQMCGLSVTDKMPTALASLANTDGKQPTPRVLVPALKVTPDAFGVMAWATCLPKVGLAEFQKAAPYLADAWRMTRVSVLPGGKPGQVMLRGVRVDPLITPTVHVPTGRTPEEYAKWDLGVDEFGMPVFVPLKEVPGVAMGGLPGFGKTSCVNRLVCDWAPSPAVQFVFLDGKVSHAYEGDYADLVRRAFAFCGDDLEEANKLLKELVELRRGRSASIRSVLGVKNMWHIGPSADWPLVLIVIDEAHTYFRDHKGSDPATKRLAALAAENARLVEDLVKKGRSVGFLTLLTTQKTTGDAIPTFIRDVCPVGLSFAQKTADAAVAALGDDIREWPDASPVNLQDPAYVGVTVMSQHGRPGFVRIRTPYVADEDAARVAEATAHLVHHPAQLLEKLSGRTAVDLAKEAPGPPAKAA